MTHSSCHCSHAHHHEHHCHHRRKHHSHHDLTLPCTHISIQEDRQTLTQSTEETDVTTTTSQSAVETTDNDFMDTTTERSCLYPTAVSKRVSLRHGIYPLHVSVNLRIAGTNTVLLPEDVFVPIAGSETLESIFEAALVRHPQQVGRYILRREKDVVVLCHDEGKNTYSKTTVVFAALSKLQPIRLIFCVVPNVEVIRELDSLKNYTIKVNARTESDPECILEKDVTLQAQGNLSAKDLWRNLAKRLPQIRGLFPTGLLTRRPDDNVVVRFGMHDFVADLVKSRGRRFVFILGGHLSQHIQRRHTEHEPTKHSGRHNNHPESRMRFKLWFRIRPYRYGQGKRMFQWGLQEKKQEPMKTHSRHRNSKG